VLLKDTPGQTVIADKGHGAQARVVQPSLDKGKPVVVLGAVHLAASMVWLPWVPKPCSTNDM
jgi:hypothetical protein